MKVIKILLLFATIAMAANVWAKEKENVKVDSNFFWINKDQSFEPYEPVLLNGTYNVQSVKSIKLNYQMNNMPFSVNVAMANGNWSASVGSFLPHQSIVLNFDVQIEADKAKIFELRQSYISIFSSIIDSLDRFRQKEDSETSVFKEKIILGLDKKFTDEFVTYKDENGKSIKEYFIDGIHNTKSLDNFNRLKDEIDGEKTDVYNMLNVLKDFDNDLYNKTNDSIKVYFSLDKKIKRLFRLSIDINKTGTDIEKIKSFINVKLNKFDSLNSVQQTILDSLVPKEGFLMTIPFMTSLHDNKTLKFELKNFIGFELMPAYFIDRSLSSTFGLFFSASPYFGWTNPDEKIFQKDSLWNNLRRFITPTLGFGLSTSPKTNQVMPLVYAGIGFRMNNIVRISFGNTFFTQKYETPKDGSDPIIQPGYCWTLGVGISIDYLADFMKVFSTTVNQFAK